MALGSTGLGPFEVFLVALHGILGHRGVVEL